MMTFETQIKYGNRWSDRGTQQAETSRGAALITGYVYGRRVIRVRPEDSRDKFIVYRFGFTPELHHGR